MLSSYRYLKYIFWSALVLSVLLAIAVGIFATWGYMYVTRDLPQLNRIEDYRPPAVTKVFSSDGALIAEFFEERRYPVKLNEVPPFVRNAFLAAEDSSFYSHPGIDVVSILRAFVKNFQSGSTKQGASTITQQVVKNLLLSPKKDYRRKIKEAILAYRIEQRLSKDEILEIYLNQMFFGNSAYGIKAAAQIYFHTTLEKLTVAQAAMLAGLLKAPSKFSPISNYQRAKERQEYVIRQMTKANFINADVAEAAINEKLTVYKAENDKNLQAPYYDDEVRRALAARLGSEQEIDLGGYEVHTALDMRAQQMADSAMQRGLREVDKRRGWRGVRGRVEITDWDNFARQQHAENGELQPNAIYQALVVKLERERGRAAVRVGATTGIVDLNGAQWARRMRDSHDRISGVRLVDQIKPGDLIEVSLKSSIANAPAAATDTAEFELNQTPDVEGALLLSDPHSGKVLAVVGGYDYQRSEFNRATQSLRQPGSSFKPVVYLAAVDGFGFTPSTIVYDEPRTFRVGDEFWTPGNFDEKYMGPITLRTALEKSRNLVSADIISRIGIDPVIQYARKLGFTSPLGRNLSLSLGSSEVTMLELVRAYGVLAARGVLFDSVFVTKIIDRNGKVIFDYESEMLNHAKQVINERSAFIMTNLMKGVIEHGTGYRIKALGRPVAGKTGTSNDQMDAWFLGFTPHWVAGAWVGFDTKREIGDQETGGRVAAPIWLYLMQDFLKYNDALVRDRLLAEGKAEAERLGLPFDPESENLDLPPPDFAVPEGVDPYWVNKHTGLLSSKDDPDAILEYFIQGTEPGAGGEGEASAKSYLEDEGL